MRIGPFVLERRKAAQNDLVTQWPTPIGGWGPSTWWPVIRESFAGAWQRGITVSVDNVLTHSTAWSCITLIAADIAKMGLTLVSEDTNGICTEIQNAAYSPVLRRPNHYQNRIQFIKSWLISLLTRGNTYVLKERDNRGIVTALYVLDPSRVKVLVGGDQVFYEVQPDNLADVNEAVQIPASEIIHDIYAAPFHPLCGVSPIYACGMAATQGLNILHNSARLFQNGSQPGGVLTAPGSIGPDAAKRIQEHWDANFGGEQNIGRVAVLGDGLKFERMSMTAVDAQLIDQLKWGDEKVCSVFHVPPYMVGVGPMPTYNNVEALNQQYYSQCLQILVEQIELCLEEGLRTDPYEIEFDTDDLLRMDSATQMKFVTDGIKGLVLTPNDGRKKFNLPKVVGGDELYGQEQDHSLRWLSTRDSMPIQPKPAPQPSPTEPTPPVEPVKAFDYVALRAALMDRVKGQYVNA